MRKLCFQVLLSAAVWVSLCGVASAKGHGGDHGHGASGHGNPFASSGDHDRDHGDHDRDRHFGDRDRDHHVGPSSRPPGWDKGKKTGWGNCNEPPGLAKKNGGCGSRGHGHHDDHIAHHDTHTHHTTTAQSGTHRTWPWQRSTTTGTASGSTPHSTTGSTSGQNKGAGGLRRPSRVAPNVN